VRCTHESSLYRENSFLTLTYDDKRLPEGYDLREGLIYSHFQVDFLKALRDRCGGLTKVRHHNFGKINSKTGEPYPEFHHPIRFYVSGEYGTVCKTCGLSKKFCKCAVFIRALGRPHWHALMFNFDFSDKYFWRWSKPNEWGEKTPRYPIYRSPTLEELWPYGNSEIGSVTYQSAGYCARYIMKKQTGEEEKVRKYYELVDADGRVFNRRPEFCKMSVRPGVGEGWFRKYHTDVYPLDRVILRDGREVKPPRYYDKKFFQMTKEILPVCPFFDPETGELFEDEVSPTLDNIKHNRLKQMQKKLDDPNRPSLESERLLVEAKVAKLKRSLS